MSLLEDVFLEDEAGEAQELERVIDGDEYDERPAYPNSDDNEEKDDEAVEDKRRVDPTQTKTKRVVNPRFVLNPARLTGPRGIQIIPEHFKDFKFQGKGHEKEDLDMVLKKLEHWAYRLYPKFGFHDCLKKIETLGRKRTVMVHLTKIRSDQFLSEETVVQKDSSDDETPSAPPEEDEFDKLLQQQIELARTTPAPGSVKKPPYTPSVDRSNMMPKATSSPSISDEQKERMLRNRRLAEERRLARLKNNSDNEITSTPRKPTIVEENESEVIENPNEVVVRKHNRSQIIDSDSSDEEVAVVNESITIDADIHRSVGRNNDDIEEINDPSNTETTDNNMEGIIDEVSHQGNNRNDFDNVIHKNDDKIDDVETTSNSNNKEVIVNQTNDINAIIPTSVVDEDDADNNLVMDLKENDVEEISHFDTNSNEGDIAKNYECSEHIIISDNNIYPESNVDKSNETESNKTDSRNITKVSDNSVLQSNKENIDRSIVENVMDVDFSDDF